MKRRLVSTCGAGTAEYVKTAMLQKREMAKGFDPVSRDIVSIDAPAPDTLVVRLARPTRAIIESMRTISPGSEMTGAGPSTGPYRMVARSADRVDYEAFPDFVGGTPALPPLQTRLYPSSRLAWAAFLRKEVDMLYEVPSNVAAQLAEAQLAQINVRLKPAPLTNSEYVRRVGAGEYETYLGPMAVLRAQLWPYIFWRSGAPQPPLRSHYTAADAALDAAYGAMDDETERAAVRQVQQIMRDDPPAAFLTMVPMNRAVRRRWKLPRADNVPPGVAPEIRDSIWRWTLASSECGTS